MANSDSACLASGFCTSFNTQVRQGRDDGAMFVSNFHPDVTQEELSEEVAPFRKYERLIMRVSFSPFHFLEHLGFLSRLIIIGPDSKYAFFVYSYKDRVEQILRIHQRNFHHRPGAKPMHRTYRDSSIRHCPLGSWQTVWPCDASSSMS